jgi:hypothetical protein
MPLRKGVQLLVSDVRSDLKVAKHARFGASTRNRSSRNLLIYIFEAHAL